MQRKFECLNCHNQFEADDQTVVQCPKCGADNIEIAHFHLPKGWWKWGLVIIILIGVGYFLANNDWSMCLEDEPKTDIVEEVDTTDVFVEDSLYIDEEAPKFEVIPSIVVGTPSYAGDGYVFTVKVKNAPAEKYYVALLEHNGTKVIARSDDEHFSKVPPSNNEGAYDVAVFLASNDSMLCEAMPVIGFDSQEVVKEKMTKERLQELLEDVNSNLTGSQDWIVANYKLHFTGLSADDKLPTQLSEVQTQVDLLWEKAIISQLKYDAKNRITDIFIDVQK